MVQRVVQMFPAAPGMYRLQTADQPVAELIVAWAQVVDEHGDVRLYGVGLCDINNGEAINDICAYDPATGVYTTRLPDNACVNR